MPGRRRYRGFGLYVLAALLGACGSGEERVFEEIASPDGAYILRVTVAEPRTPHGRFRIGAYLLAAGEASGPRVVDVKLENDGVPFTTRNLAVRWTSRRAALMCLRATDLPDRGFRIEVGETPGVTEVEQC